MRDGAAGEVTVKVGVIKDTPLEWPTLETEHDRYIIASGVNLEEAADLGLAQNSKDAAREKRLWKPYVGSQATESNLKQYDLNEKGRIPGPFCIHRETSKIATARST